MASSSPFISTPFLNHVYDSPPVAVSVTDPPWQTDAFAGEILPVGALATVTTALFDAGPLQLSWKIVTV